MTGTGIWQVVTTTDSENAAQQLADGLVEARLAACVQVDGPIRSTYRWEGTAANDPEWRLTIKTSAARYEQMAQWLVSHHSYDVPEILATEVVDGHQPYIKWAHDETNQAEPPS